MAFTSINPATGEALENIPGWGSDELQRALAQVAAATPGWASSPLQQRCTLMRRAASVLRDRRDELARIITTEMGKLFREACAEVDKCALVCDHYADNGPRYLADELINSDAGKSCVTHQPLGTVLAVMPWNFPFWQVFRFAAPTLTAGNTGVLKHASNVPRCALAIESVFREAGFPDGVFRTLLIEAAQVEEVIKDPRIHAVTLTGSEPAGRRVAAVAGAALKKTVLELGGSDPFIVLEDCELESTVREAVASRFLNAGQSCIAAKRFILVESVAASFLEKFRSAVESLQPGDPMLSSTTLAPMARCDLRDELHRQVIDSIEQGAIPLTGCAPVEGSGAFYQASILDRVEPGMRAYEEELFGPVATVIRARDENEAMEIANSSRFGLGGSIWTADSSRGERLARELQAGCCFVNGMVKSDPRLPFGGIKASGYGRELSWQGMLEFVNTKTIWIK